MFGSIAVVVTININSSIIFQNIVCILWDKTNILMLIIKIFYVRKKHTSAKSKKFSKNHILFTYPIML